MAILKSTKLTLGSDTSAAAVAKYLETTGAYYAQDGQSANGNPVLPAAEWLDSPAVAQMSLNAPGRTQEEQNSDLAKLLAGYHPTTGEKLVQNAGKPDRCMAFDLTFSPRKEYSLAFVAAKPDERDEMTAVFHRARDKALALISDGLNTRAGKGGKRHVGIEGLIVRAVDHIDSREGEPQWHCHALIANVALDRDGKYRTVDPRALMKRSGSLQEAAQEVFARELARGFQAMTIGIERKRVLDAHGRDTGKVANTIIGVDQETCDVFSTRRKQILKGLADAKGKVNANGKKINATDMAKSSRKQKELSATEVIGNARALMEERARLKPGLFHKTADLMGRASVELETTKEPDAWFDDMHAMESQWNRSSLIAKMARELPLDSDVDVPQEADRLLAQWETEGKILRLTDDPQLGFKRWCSRTHWFIEESVLPAARERAQEQALRLNRLAVEMAIAEHETAMSKALKKPVQLTDEQKASVFHVACDTGGLACIIGRAGTGKSASAGAYVLAFKAAGRRVIGTSTSQAATDNLKKEADIDGMNTAELLHALDSGRLALTATDVIVLDEAGMVGAKTFRRIQQHVDKAGGKLIAVGDPKQLQAIEAGSPFSQLCESFGAAAITQIQRQRNEETRTLAESFYNEKKTGEEIVQEMLAKGMLQVAKHQIKALAKAYLADHRDVRDKLIVVNTLADGEAVDNIVREGLKANDTLRAGSAVALTLGEGEHEHELEVCIGERIRFQSNARKDKKTQKREWNNNDIGTVIGMQKARGKRGFVLKIQLDDGRRVDVDTSKFPHIGYAYARTAHSAQGLGAASTYWLARGGMLDRNMGLVAMTRTKENFHAFASPLEVARLATALDEWGQKETVKELARRKNAPTVAHGLGKPIPTILGEAEHPMDAGISDLKRQQTHEALDHAEEIQRAGRDFNQAMERWKDICDRERGSVLQEIDVLNTQGGDIDRFKGLSTQVDEQLRKSLESGYKRAISRVKRLEVRLAILNPADGASRKQAQQEMIDWLEKDYIGGAKAAFRDLGLRQASPWLAGYAERAKQRRKIVIKRQLDLQAQLDEIQRTQEPGPELVVMQQAVQKRAQKVANLHDSFDRMQGEKHKAVLKSRQRRVALGLDTTTPMESIDWETSRFPDRDALKSVEQRETHTPSTAPKTRKRVGILPTQPTIRMAPKPPEPEIDFF